MTACSLAPSGPSCPHRSDGSVVSSSQSGGELERQPDGRNDWKQTNRYRRFLQIEPQFHPPLRMSSHQRSSAESAVALLVPRLQPGNAQPGSSASRSLAFKRDTCCRSQTSKGQLTSTPSTVPAVGSPAPPVEQRGSRKHSVQQRPKLDSRPELAAVGNQKRLTQADPNPSLDLQENPRSPH